VSDTESYPAWRIGLTGGIGSGKSTVAEMLGLRGADIIDADAISRATTQTGGLAIPAISAQFGSSFIASDGSMDREKMRARVFEQAQDRQLLESIIHPLVAEEVHRRIEASVAPCLVFDIPLLVESSHWRVRLDHIMVIDCAVDTQIRRVQRRNTWHRNQVESVISSQCSRLERLAAADTVLLNDGDDMKALESLVALCAHQFGL
jgi:dephospho-CoA kinase